MTMRRYAPNERWLVVSAEPGGLNPRMHFRDSEASAFELARIIRRDLGRDAYVAGLQTAHYATRKGATE